MLSFEILAACGCRGVQALEMDWPTKQSLWNTAIVEFLCPRVCSLMYRRSDCLVGLITGCYSCHKRSGETNSLFRW